MDEILYIDQMRLDDYAEQVNPSLATIDKAKKFGFELSLTGPKALVGQEERARPWSRGEKMTAVLARLREEGKVRDARPSDESDGPSFVYESRLATKVIVPYAAAPGDFKNPEFNLWFSGGEGATAARLCMVEDYRDPDDRPVSFRGASTYTLLQSLVHYTRSRPQASLLDSYIPNEPHPNAHASFDGKPDSLQEFHNVKMFCDEFAKRPTPLLQTWGCLIRTPCRIKTLYRIKEWGLEAANSFRSASVFAYPIWIIVDES